MKKALVTGSAGFIGRHFTRFLEARGWEVTGVDLVGGVNALDVFSSDETRYDLTVHSAYHVGGRAAIDGTNMHLPHNLQLDAGLFDWAVRTRQRRVLYFSSSAAYPVEYQTAEWLKRWGADDARLKESDISLTHPLPPDTHYGWAKVTGEKQAAVARGHGVSVTVVRPFSGYSHDQSLDYPFPSILHRALREEYHVWGPEGQTRDWIHVDDVISASMAVAESGEEEPVNLCTGRGVSMGDLMRMAVHEAHLEEPSRFPHADEIDVLHLQDKPAGVFYRVGDSTQMKRFWAPRISLEMGLRRGIRSMLR